MHQNDEIVEHLERKIAKWQRLKAKYEGEDEIYALGMINAYGSILRHLKERDEQ